MKTFTVVIADDHEIIRDAIQSKMSMHSDMGQTDFELLACAENGIDAIATVKAHKPDLLFLDISMPLANGSEIIHDIRRWSPDTKVVVFTGVSAPGLIASIVETGVDGLFSKSTSLNDMFQQIPTIMQGGRYVAPELVEIIDQGQKALTLTGRERQILNMVVAGKTNKDIASELNISPKTVDKHRTSLMQKLDVHSVAKLMVRALQDGLVEPV
ncbi:response regulator transcription factor [Pseudoteredinibacter isoporae]|uniref:response regulator transcription factor n=1 Tax=Pseudoteredinibacter isoporae TaxID=570281 RepID=UPI00310BCE9D